MENKSHALAAGIFVLVVAAMLAGLAMWLTRDVTSTDTYQMTTSNPVTGLQVQAPVRYKGVAVGKVTAIGFDPDVPGNVLVTMAIATDAPVTDGTFATLGFQGVTGLSFVQLDDAPGGVDKPLERGPDGAPARIPLRPNLFGTLTDHATELMEQLSSITGDIKQLLGPENQAALHAMMKEIGAAAKSVNQLAVTVDNTVTSQFDLKKGEITTLVRESQSALQSVRNAADSTGKMTEAWRSTAKDAQQMLSSLNGPDGVVQRLSQSADAVTTDTLPRIDALASDAARTLNRVEGVAGRLDENPQSLLFGDGPVPPGPGEPGFTAPAAARP